MSSLAGSVDPDEPGLPRGRGRLVADDVLAAQRPRLLRAVIAAVAENGFAATTIADIVARARVSRQAFYRQFDSKEACFLAAIDSGTESVVAKIVRAGEDVMSSGTENTLRTVLRAYLETAAGEPEFTRAWTLELPNAGVTAMHKRNTYLDILAASLRRLHRETVEFPEEMPMTTYLAVIGGCNELFYRYVADGRTADLPELEQPMMQFVQAVL